MPLARLDGVKNETDRERPGRTSSSGVFNAMDIAGGCERIGGREKCSIGSQVVWRGEVDPERGELRGSRKRWQNEECEKESGRTGILGFLLLPDEATLSWHAYNIASGRNVSSLKPFMSH